jgi:hypothetical protein
MLSPAEHRLDKRAAAKLEAENINSVSAQPSHKGRYQCITVTDLQVDYSYQRKIVERQVAQIIDYFNWDAFSTPVVGKRQSGGLYIIDGQQRIEAVLRLGVTKVNVEIVVSTGAKFEANLFHQLNARKTRLTKIEIFRSALKADNQFAVDIYSAVRAAGFDIPLEPGVPGKWPYVRALSRLEQLYKDGGSERIITVLSLIHDMWEGEDDAVREDVIGGLHRFIKFTRYNERRPEGWLEGYMAARRKIRRDRIVEAVTEKKLTAAGLHIKASNSKEASSGYSRAEAVQRILDETCSFHSRKRA